MLVNTVLIKILKSKNLLYQYFFQISIYNKNYCRIFKKYLYSLMKIKIVIKIKCFQLILKTLYFFFVFLLNLYLKLIKYLNFFLNFCI